MRVPSYQVLAALIAQPELINATGKGVRRHAKRKASLFINPELVQCLRRRFKKNNLPPHLSIEHASLLIASLGGHLPRNGPPGWQTLGAGYQRLLELTSSSQFQLPL
ncbi:MAG: hypothetical protein IPJ88_04645 [Myxococcales bacterium]|nr:MAG: hypothetical protein IPJ88_04645 [Myxococcales bacterium]